MRLKVKSCVGSISPLLALIKFLKSLNFKRNNFPFSKEFIRKPFVRPPPSSFEAPQACTVSLSAPLSRVISHGAHCEGGGSSNCGLGDLEGPLSQGCNFPDKNGTE